MDLRVIMGKVASGVPLGYQEMAEAFDSMLSGKATPAQMGGLLLALRVRGETVEEIAGAVSAMRGRMRPVNVPPDSVDIAGTGGDGSGSVNVSTCASFIVAGARHSCRQARKPRAVLTLRLRRRTGIARSKDRFGAR